MQTEVKTHIKYTSKPTLKRQGGIYERYGKRLIDIVFSFLAIIVLSPVFLIIALLVKINLGSPVIFKQKRPGLNEKIFTMYKFRTMTNERNEKGLLLSDEIRITKFGNFLRSTSLDELLELLNIFKGQMSFVGPRPLSVNYLPCYTEREKRRHAVRPGLTGLAQINGRNIIKWEDRFAYDIKYIKNMSLVLDIYIIFRTIYQVILRKDIGCVGVDGPEDFDEYRRRSSVSKDSTKIVTPTNC